MNSPFPEDEDYGGERDALFWFVAAMAVIGFLNTLSFLFHLFDR